VGSAIPRALPEPTAVPFGGDSRSDHGPVFGECGRAWPSHAPAAPISLGTTVGCPGPFGGPRGEVTRTAPDPLGQRRQSGTKGGPWPTYLQGTSPLHRDAPPAMGVVAIRKTRVTPFHPGFGSPGGGGYTLALRHLLGTPSGDGDRTVRWDKGLPWQPDRPFGRPPNVRTTFTTGQERVSGQTATQSPQSP
jgi:hypothetical protein